MNSSVLYTGPRRKPKSTGFLFEMFKNRAFYSMMIPGLLFVIIFSYLPMGGAIIAFKQYNPTKGIFGSPWAGLKNFKFFFTSQAAATVTFNTIFYNFIQIISVTGISILFAILLNETGSKALTGIYKDLMLLPFFLSWVVAQYILYTFLSTDGGIVNRMLTALHLNAFNWYMDAGKWRAIMPLAYIWKGVGYTSVIYVAAISGISSEYYEAAEIDGASKFRQAIQITIPMIMPVIATLTLLNCGKLFNGGLGDWGAFYNLPMDSGMLYSTTDVIDTYVFRAMRGVNDLGMSSAIGFFQSVVGFVLVLLANLIIKKTNPESSLF